MSKHYWIIILMAMGLLDQSTVVCHAQASQNTLLTRSLAEELELKAYQYEMAGERTSARVAYGQSVVERAQSGVIALTSQGGAALSKYLYEPFDEVITRGEALQRRGQLEDAEELYTKTLKQLEPRQAGSSSARRLQQKIYLLESARGQKSAEQFLADLTLEVLKEWGPYSDLYTGLLYEQINHYDNTRQLPLLVEALNNMSNALRLRQRGLAAFLLNDFEYDSFLVLHQRYIDQLLATCVKYHDVHPELENLIADYLLVARNLQLKGQRIIREQFILKLVGEVAVAFATSLGIPYLKETLKKTPSTSKEYREATVELARSQRLVHQVNAKARRNLLYNEWKLAKLNPDSDRNQLDRLEHQLIDSVGQFIDQLAVPVPGLIANRLSPEKAIVDFFSYKRGGDSSAIQYAAVVYRHKPASPGLVLLGSRAEIWQLIRQQRIQSTMSSYQLMNSINQLYKSPQLYELLWKPLMPMLNGIRQIDYLPMDLLNSVAFDALATQSGGKLLGEQFRLKRILTVPAAFTDSVVIAPDKLPERQVNADFWGGIVYDTKAAKIPRKARLAASTIALRGAVTTLTRGRNWSPLKGTGEEISKIRSMLKLFKARHLGSYRKTKASEFAFKHEYTILNQPQILHIATHGFYDNMTLNDPGDKAKKFTSPYEQAMLKAGLVLAGANIQPEAGQEDGILTALEISQLNFNSKLVVLSACESGLGEQQSNEGIIGLQRAFKLAGAEYLLMTLWEIPDQETTDMMGFFYGNLMKGQSIDTAFLNAQASMKTRYSPFFWAGFVLLH